MGKEKGERGEEPKSGSFFLVLCPCIPPPQSSLLFIRPAFGHFEAKELPPFEEGIFFALLLAAIATPLMNAFHDFSAAGVCFIHPLSAFAPPPSVCHFSFVTSEKMKSADNY